MIRVLITGFEPFDNEMVNPSHTVASALHGRVIENVDFIGITVPTRFDDSIQTLYDAIETHKPNVVICLGQAGGRSKITPERIAININDARIPDNHGNQPIDTPVIEGGPVAYLSTLPIKQIVNNLMQAGIPAMVSNSAGTFVCNHLFYGLMHGLETLYPDIRGGFIHIPYLPEQTTHRDAPSMSIDMMTRGIEIAALTTAEVSDDILITGGTEC